MQLKTECIDRLLNLMKASFATAYLVTQSETNASSLLGQTSSNLTKAAVETKLVTFGTATSGSMTTTNSATNENAFNFSIKAGITANSIAFVSAGNAITGLLNLTVGRTGAATYGSGLYITKIDVTLTESV